MSRLILTKDVVKSVVPRFTNGRALDVGAGTAKYREFIRRYASTYETCDIQAGPAVNHVADVQRLEFPDESFDTVFAFQVLEHVENPERAVSEIYRCLKSGGVCILTVPFLVAQHADPGDFHRYTLKGIETLFTKGGFEIVESGTYGGPFTVLGEFVKFQFLSPYEEQRLRVVRRAVFGRIIRLLYYFDRIGLWRNSNFYANSFVVGRR